MGRAQSERPALILTDIVMPEMNGLEITRQLRQSPGLSNVPIIAVSASASGSDEKESLAAGANAFLPKPVDFDRLLAKIATLLKLEWRYAAPSHPPSSDAVGGVLVAPPAQEMDDLYRLACLGNMRGIVQWADHLAELDPRYGPFTAQFRMLAKGYESKAILALVEQHLAARGANVRDDFIVGA